MRHIVKVYCLPRLGLGRLHQLHLDIVQAMVKIPELSVRGAEDVLTLFVPDIMMGFSSGTPVLIEVDVYDEPPIHAVACEKMAQRLGQIVYDAVRKPNADIQCRVYHFKTAGGFWSTKHIAQLGSKGMNFVDTSRPR